jgi:hypothetical protein
VPWRLIDLFDSYCTQCTLASHFIDTHREKGPGKRIGCMDAVLPDDALQRVAELLAREVNSSTMAALNGLHAVSKTWLRVLHAARPFQLAAHTLRLPPHGEQHARMLCHIAAIVRDMDAEAGIGDSMYVVHQRRAATGIRSILSRLEPLGLACVWSGDGALPTTPFVVVWCDAASRPATRSGISNTSTMVTWPCAAKRCMNPAAVACMHCSKHGGRFASSLIQCCVEQRAARHGVGQVIFAAPSTDVMQSYKRALAHARRRGKASTGSHGGSLHAPCCRHDQIRHRGNPTTIFESSISEREVPGPGPPVPPPVPPVLVPVVPVKHIR